MLRSFGDDDDINENSNDADDNKPVWPTWAVGAHFRVVGRIHINRICSDRLGMIIMMTMIIIMMLMIISPFGQLGLWAPSSGV
jgi:hypothetical protein